MNKPVQYFSREALERSRDLSTEQIVEFVENFRLLHGGTVDSSKSVLISIKIPADLLAAFRALAVIEGTKYQTKIKQLMRNELIQ